MMKLGRENQEVQEALEDPEMKPQDAALVANRV